jgi:hypothetical protein
MSQLNSIVRRVLLEATPVVQGGAITVTGKPGPDEPQDAAPVAQPRVKAAAKKVKIDNAIAPNAMVDPGVYIESSSIGYDKPPEEINRLLKTTPKKGDLSQLQFDVEDTKSRSDVLYASVMFGATQILGDSAIAESQVHSESVVKDRAVSRSHVGMSRVTSCELTGATLSAARIDSCKVRAGTTIAGKLVKTPLIATYATFDGGYQLIQGSGTISTSKLSGCKNVDLYSEKTRIAGSTITLSDISLKEVGGVAGTISLADIDQSRIQGGVTIKGLPGAAVNIGFANIVGNAKVITTKPGKPPRVIGFPAQPAVVMDNAKVYDSAYVSGRVEGDAEVFGEAQVEGLATISGDCKVGGTAVMVSGVFTKGEFTEGRHEDGDEGARMKDSISYKFKTLLGID